MEETEIISSSASIITTSGAQTRGPHSTPTPTIAYSGITAFEKDATAAATVAVAVVT